jgi:hypothetical protein
MGLPTSREAHGSRAAIVLKCLGQCPGQGEGPQGYGNVRDRVVEATNRKGISGQGRLSPRPGEPDAWKLACPVREGTVGKGPSSGNLQNSFWQVGRASGTSLAVYFMYVA